MTANTSTPCGSDAYQVVRDFEQAVADYAGAKYGVAVDSCTNAIFLCCKYFKVDYRQKQAVHLPKKTYVGVAYSVLHAGGRIKFHDFEWSGAYQLLPYLIIDSARRFRREMYVPTTLYCLSFHWSKHIPIGRGGMILTDNEDAVKWLKQARFDGRTEGVSCKDDDFTVLGYHFYLTPELAARGLMLMQSVKDSYPDLPEENYPDLSRYEIFKK